MATKDTWAIIQERIDAMTDRNTRMDDTAKFLQWDDPENKYQLTTPAGAKIDDGISVTPNIPKVFVHSVVADLLSGQWQTQVEGNVSKTQAHVIETFVDDNLAQADEGLLDKYDIPSLDSWLCNHVCVRWAIGVMWIASVENGEYKIHCQPMDMRYTPFVRGKWVAPITWCSRDEVEQKLEEYGKRATDEKIGEFTKQSFESTPDIEVRDFYGNEKHELWVASKLAYTEKNHLGYPPAVIVVPASGFMLRGTGYLKHEGEDILYLIEGLVKEYARSISLEQTLGYKGLFPAYEKTKKVLDGKPSQPVPKTDTSQDVLEGERHEPIKIGDVNRAEMTASTKIGAMIEAGAPVSPKMYNTPPSAILLAGETELISRLQNVRKEALGIFRSQLARMIIKQYINLEETETKIGRTGKVSKYSASKLGNLEDYTISYHLSIKSKRQELANLAEFTAAYDKLPLEWNLTNILMVDDVGGVMDALKLQNAKRANPALELPEIGLGFLTKADETEDEYESDLLREQAKMVAHEYVMLMRSRMQPQLPLASPGSPAVPPKGQRGSSQLLNQMGGAAGALKGAATRQEVTQ